MKEFIVNVETMEEARVVVSLCAEIDDSKYLWSDCSLDEAVDNGFYYDREVLLINNEVYDAPELTLDELFALARDGWEKPRWKPEIEEIYVIADPTQVTLFYSDVWCNDKDKDNVHQLKHGLVFPNTEEGKGQAVELAKKMLECVNK